MLCYTGVSHSYTLFSLYSCRVKAFIRYGWDKNIKSPYGQSTGTSAKADSPTSIQQYEPPKDGWISIKQAFKSNGKIPQFNNGHIIVYYFVTRSVIDGLPSNDFKSINSYAENLFKCGHVQHIELCKTMAFYMHAYLR